MNDRTWTVIEILKVAREYLADKGVENARGDAEALLGKVLAVGRVQLYLQHDRPLTRPELDSLRELLKRRSQHEPLQLILGTIEFGNARIEVVPGLLIPRPETEELTERVITVARDRFGDMPIRVLDIGSGTGCISVAIAKALPNAQVDALDVDFEAIRATDRNARHNEVGSRVRTRLGDVFSSDILQLLNPPYDLVVANPPYIPESDYDQLPPEVRNHEHRRALIAGPTGIEFFRRIADLLPVMSRTGALVAFEFGYGQGKELNELFRPFFESLSLYEDLSGIPRMLVGTVGESAK